VEKPILTIDGKLGCSHCLGTGNVTRAFPDEGIIHSMRCVHCVGSGLLVDVVKREKESLTHDLERAKAELNTVRNWLKENSTCSKCRGDQFRTPGGTKCPECGLEGLAPWGG
jgi:hypothetical protein